MDRIAAAGQSALVTRTGTDVCRLLQERQPAARFHAEAPPDPPVEKTRR